MESKKINQLATEMSPAASDLTIIGDPITGVSKKITLEQISYLFGGTVSFYTNYASFPATGEVDVIYCAKDTKKLYLWSGSAYVEMFPSQALLDTYQLRSEKGNANGYASLDSLGKVPISQLPSSIMEYKGMWNAATNTPTLANGTGDTGDVYICNVAGTVNFGAGAITFAVGDYVVYSGTIWQRSSGATGTVTSVAVTETGDALTITGSPITTSGTINIGFAGTGSQYIKGDGTLATFPTTISEAQKLVTEVYNSTGATLTKGTVVYINGGQGNLPTVTKALATGDSTSAQTYGVVKSDITNMNNGYVVVMGALIDLDTQAYSVGTQLYLSSTTAGAWTTTKQYAPNHLVYVGIVVRSHPTQGVVEVRIQNGFELDELHNVSAQTPSNNNGIFYNTSTSLWEAKSIATALGYTPANDSLVVHLSGSETITGTKTFNPQQKFDGTLAIKEGTSGTLTGYTVLGANTNQLLVGVVGATHTLTFPSSTGYVYTLPSATGTLALTSDLSSYVLTTRTISTTAPLQGGGDLSANRTLSITQATTSTNGYLSSTDWNTFNGKQNALTNPVTGTGTSGQVTYFNGTSSITSSANLAWDGTNLSIGNPSSPLAQLHVYNASAAATILLQTNSTTDYSEIAVRNNSSTATSYFRQYSTATTGSDFGISRAGLALFFSNYATNFAIGTRNGGNLIFGTADTERARINTSGNFGIGTTSPTSPLHVGTATSGNQKIQQWGEPGFVDNYGLILRGSSLDGIFKFYGLNNGTETSSPILSMNRSNGNVGIGTSTPNTYSNYTNLQVNGTSAGMVQVSGSSSTLASFYAGSGIGQIGTTSNHPFMFFTNDVERARITSGGVLCVGTTSGFDSGKICSDGGTDYTPFAAKVGTTANAGQMYFRNPNGIVGSITSSGSATSFNTSSDYRLKQDIKDYNGLSLVSAIKTYDYEWKSDNTRAYGVLAHELAEVIPYAVHGQKDGKEMQGVDYSKIVPILVKAIQEQQQQIEELKLKIK